MIRLLLLLAVATNASKAVCDSKDVKAILRGCKDFPGLTVTLTNGKVIDEKNCGLLLPKNDFADEPVFRMTNAEADKFYTIIMVDPDAPNHKEGQFYLHMIKSNVQGSALKSGKTEGNEYTKYVKPTPPKGTGRHRYISVVFKQETDKFSPSVPDSRAKFSLADWLEGKQLCGPVAAVEFKCEH